MAKVHVQTKINGEEVEVLCEPRQSLLEVLREELGFTPVFFLRLLYFFKFEKKVNGSPAKNMHLKK